MLCLRCSLGLLPKTKKLIIFCTSRSGWLWTSKMHKCLFQALLAHGLFHLWSTEKSRQNHVSKWHRSFFPKHLERIGSTGFQGQNAPCLPTPDMAEKHCPIWNVYFFRATTSKVASEGPAFPRHLQSVAWNDLERVESESYLCTPTLDLNPRSINDCKNQTCMPIIFLFDPGSTLIWVF